MFRPENLSPTVRSGIIVVALTGALLSLLGRHYYEHSRAVPVVLQTAPIDPRSVFQGDYVTLGYDINTLPAKIFVQPEDPKQKVSGEGYVSEGYLVNTGDPVYVALKDVGMIWTDLRASFSPFTELKTDEQVITRVIEKDAQWRLRWLFDWNSAEFEKLTHTEYKDGVSRNTQAPLGTIYYVLQRKIGPVWQAVRASTRPLKPEGGEVILRGTALSSLWREGSDLRVTYGIEAFFVPEGDGKWVDQMQWSRQRDRFLVRVKIGPNGTGYTDNILLDGKEAFKNSGLESWSSWKD
jgi:uncharacterized membrane-anchored protein